jgi:3-oxoadipate enol-lactonase
MTDHLHALVDGADDAPPLVLGGSLGTVASVWDPLLPAMTSQFRVVRYDHLGHGESDNPPGPYTIEWLGRAVLGLLDRLGLDRVAYAGLSLGGMVGIWLAANAPDRIDRVALMCTAARVPAQPWWDRAAAVEAGGIAAIAGPVAGRWFTPHWASAHADAVRELRDVLEGLPADGYVACCAAIASMDLRPDLARIAVPTLVIGGAEDAAIPVEYQREIAEGVVGSRLLVLDDAAHLAPVQHPGTVAEALVGHLRAPEPRAGG